MKMATCARPGIPSDLSFFSVVHACCGTALHLRHDGRQRLVLLELDRLREEEAELLLSEEEQIYFQRFRFPKRRREWLGGRIAAKAALLRLDEPEAFRQLSILPDAHGRPTVSGAAAPSLSLSISHSGAYAAALAMPGASCGLDLQEIADQLSSLTNYFASPMELQALAQVPGLGSEATRLTMLWAVKEALKKSVLADQPVFFSGIEAKRIAAAGDRAWCFDCTVPGCPPQTAMAHDLSPYVLALTCRAA